MAHKILLVDDSITIQKVVTLTFASSEYDVVAFGSGTEALTKIDEVDPDLILLDVIMPDIKGYEVCEKIKQNPKYKDVPILLLTGTFESFDEDEANRVGANGYITKPFDHQVIIEKVNEMLEQREGIAVTEESPDESAGTVETEETATDNEEDEFAFSEDSLFEEAGDDLEKPSPAAERMDETVIFKNMNGVGPESEEKEDEIFGVDEDQYEAGEAEAAEDELNDGEMEPTFDEAGETGTDDESADFQVAEEAEESATVESTAGEEDSEAQFKDDEMVFEVEESGQDELDKTIVGEAVPQETELEAESVSFETDVDQEPAEETSEQEPVEEPESAADTESGDTDEELALDEEGEPAFEDSGQEEETVSEERVDIGEEPADSEPETVDQAFDETADESVETGEETSVQEEESVEPETDVAEHVAPAVATTTGVVSGTQQLVIENQEDLIEKISTRVAELLMDSLADKILEKIELALPNKAEGLVEKIAWEVVPDLAEILIKKEIDTIKSKTTLS